MSSYKSFSAFFDSHLSQQIRNENYLINQSIKSLHPEPQKLHLSVPDSGTCTKFPLSGFLTANNIPIKISEHPKLERLLWDPSGGYKVETSFPRLALKPLNDALEEKGELNKDLVIGSFNFRYEEVDFIVYKVSYISNSLVNTESVLYNFVFEDPTSRSLEETGSAESTVGHRLVANVYRWAASLKDEMWVFQHGAWSKDKDLWRAVRSASWDTLVLEPEFLDDLRRDTSTFFQNSTIYQKLGVQWKRGLLLLGPPGNGKTETIKLLLKESKQPALYVKSFTTEDGPEIGVKDIFEHARACAPCILVIEDIDCLVVPIVRAFFLNELDGIGKNEGILTIATTNHPERIDDAILNRPSRFDVKYTFDLPNESLRLTYSLKWIRKIKSVEDSSLDDSLSIKFQKSDEELSAEIAKRTEGWPFAFLKELFVSFLLRVAHNNATSSTTKTASYFDELLITQMTALSMQISKSNFEKTEEEEEEDDPAKTHAHNALRKMLKNGGS